MEITDKDIEKAEKIFLENNYHFNDERRKFIKCIDSSLHIQACPGSGKTTALLAKLYILSEKMPFENNQGICVLTHTNVAIDIIKRKLGERADKLLSYPNFFGTIQSFVDKYLAIPAYIKCFNKRPKYIDNDFFYIRMKKNEIALKNNNWITNNKGSYDSELDFVSDIDVRFNKSPKNNNDDWFDLNFKIKNKKSITYKKIYRFFNDIFNQGYLRYKDAFYLAKLYLDKYNEISNIFSSRFKFVFIDEAQDTSEIQKEIIEKCFNENVIIQWKGDVNQGIMNDNFTESAWNPQKDDRYDVMTFSESHRLSQPIANVVKNIAVNPDNNLEGNTALELKPKLIIFNDDQEQQILEKFAELIINTKYIYNNEELNIYEISKRTNNPIKAIGWVGKEKDNGLSIKSYFPDFEKRLKNKRRLYFPNLYTMYQLSKDVSVKSFKERTFICIIEALNISEINSTKGKVYSRTEFISWASQNNKESFDKFLSKIANYYLNNDFGKFSENVIELLDNLNIKLNDKSKKYIQESTLMETEQQQVNNSLNVFKHSINNEDVEFFIDTVHGIKGETHTATLYLETKYYSNSLNYLIDKIQGIAKKSNPGDKKNKAKKIIYVAFSRPTHLLCVSMHKNEFEKFNKNGQIDLNNTWDIIRLDN